MHAIRTCGLVSMAALAVACSGLANPSPSSTSVKQGELGNGVFTFKCDDSVACDRWNNADTFPQEIALGSNFELTFLLRDDSHGYSWLEDAERGTTIEPVGRFVGRGLSGFAAVHEGAGTFSARDSKGALVDYVSVRVTRPDGLVVYDAGYRGETPVRITSLALGVGERRELRTIAQKSLRTLAGSFMVEWTSDDPTVISVESYDHGKVTLLTHRDGMAKLKVVGTGLEQTLNVTVGTGSADAGAGDAAQDGGQ